jgi:hypothetical protein
MSIVPDLARPGDVVDPPLSSPNRRVADAPATLSLVPLFSGEIVQNTSNGDLWFAAGLTATAWTPYANLG